MIYIIHSVFVQYVQQGVFDLSISFIERVLDALVETADDQRLKYLLLNNIAEVLSFLNYYSNLI